MTNTFTVDPYDPVFKIPDKRYDYDELEKLWSAEESKDAYTKASPEIQGKIQNNFINRVVTPSINPDKLRPDQTVGQIIEDWSQRHQVKGGLVTPEGGGFGTFRRGVEKLDKMTGVKNWGFLEKYGSVENNEEKSKVLSSYGLIPKEDYYFHSESSAGYLTPKGIKKLGEEVPRPDYDLKIAPDRLTPRSAIFHSHTIARMIPEVLVAYQSGGASAVPAGARMFLTAGGMKAMDEGLESWRGFQAQTKGEVSWDAFLEGALATGAEWLTRLGGLAGRFGFSGGTARVKKEGLDALGGDVTQPFPKRISGITGFKKEFPFVERGKGGIFGKDPKREIVSTVDPEVRRILEKSMQKVGLKPDMSALDRAGYSKIFATFQDMARRFGTGTEIEKENLSQALRYLDKLMARAGARVSTSEGVKAPEGIPFSEFSKGVKKDIRKITERLEGEPKATLTEVDRYLNNARLMIDQRLKPNISRTEDDNLGELIKANMEEGWKQGSRKGRKFYREADQVVVSSGAKRVEWVRTKRLKELASEMLENIPVKKTQLKEPYFDLAPDGKVIQKTEIDEEILASQSLIKDLKDILSMGDHMTFNQAKGFRELMTGAAHDKNLLTDVGHARAGQFKKAIDEEFDDIIANGRTINDEIMPAKAVHKLKRAIKYWSALKNRWDNAEVSKLVKEGSQEPYKIVQHMDTMTTKQIDNIMKVVGKTKNGKDFQTAIRSEHFEQMMKSVINPSTGEIVAQGLLKKITQMGPSFYKLHGKDALLIERYARDLAARNFQGKLGADITDDILSKQADYGSTSASPEVIRLMQSAVKQQKELDNFVNEEFVKKINSTDEKDMRDVVRSMLSPDGKGVTQIRRMREILKDNPERQTQFENLAFRDLINTNVISSSFDTAPKVLLNGEKLLELTKRQFGGYKQDNAFIELFGEPLARDIDDFANAIKTFDPALKDGIVEKWMAIHPFDNFDRLVQFKILGSIMSNPWFFKGFLDGYKKNAFGALGGQKTAKVSMAITRFASQYLAQASRQAEAKENSFDSLQAMEEEF